MKKKLLVITMLITTVMTTVLLPQAKNVVHAATPKAIAVGKIDEPFQKLEQTAVALRTFEYQWAYRFANGRVEKRLYNNTTGNWASGSSWIPA